MAVIGLTENINGLVSIVVEKKPMHSSFINSSIRRLSPDEVRSFDEYLHYCLSEGKGLDYLAESYLTLVNDTIREQIYFQRHKRYRYARFEDVASGVYFNNEYMEKYMQGLAVASFVWPNQLEMVRFFKTTLPNEKRGSYIEVGPGHGYYLITAINQSSFETFLGVDISPASAAATNSIVNHFKNDSEGQFEIVNEDFLASSFDQMKFDAVVMGEVLEHVEEPELFLRKITEIAEDDAYIFVTTVVNAPAIDHIYHFRTLQEITNMFIECGLAVKKQKLLPYAGKSLQESIEDDLSINAAYVLEKCSN